MKFGDLCPIISKENGFYIIYLKDKSEMFFLNSDDFYESPFAKYMYDREVIWIESKNNCLRIILK